MLSRAMHKMFHVIKRSSDFFFSDEDDAYNSDISINDSSSDNSDDISNSIAIERGRARKLQNKSSRGLIKLPHAKLRNVTQNGRGAARNKQSGSRRHLPKKNPKLFQRSQNRTNLPSFSNYPRLNRSNAHIFKSYSVMDDCYDSPNNTDDNSFDSSEGRLVIDEDDFDDFENSENTVALNPLGLKNIDEDKEKNDDDNNSHCSFHASPLKVIDLCGTHPEVNVNAKNSSIRKNVNLREKKKNIQEKFAGDGIVVGTSANNDKRLTFKNEEEKEVKNVSKNRKRKRVELKKNSLLTKDACPSNSGVSVKVEKNVPIPVFVYEEKSSFSDEDSDREYFRRRNDSFLRPRGSRPRKKARRTTKKLLLMKTEDIINLVQCEEHPLHRYADIITEENIEKLSKIERKVFLHILGRLIDEAMPVQNEKKPVLSK